MRVAVVFAPVALFATVCTFLPNRILAKPEITKHIGTEKPWVARVVCLLAAIVGWFAVVIGVLDYMGKLR
jgi:hypothetical protein